MRWRLKSPASRLFTQQVIQAQLKENIKAPRQWPLCGEFTGDRWTSLHKWPVTRKILPLDDVIMHGEHAPSIPSFSRSGWDDQPRLISYRVKPVSPDNIIKETHSYDCPTQLFPNSLQIWMSQGDPGWRDGVSRGFDVALSDVYGVLKCLDLLHWIWKAFCSQIVHLTKQDIWCAVEFTSTIRIVIDPQTI